MYQDSPVVIVCGGFGSQFLHVDLHFFPEKICWGNIRNPLTDLCDPQKVRKFEGESETQLDALASLIRGVMTPNLCEVPDFVPGQ